MNAIDILTGDHNRVRGLFSLFKAAKENDDTTTMTEIAGRIFEQLDVHTTIEETVFYPRVREAGGEVAELVAEGIEEHNVVKQLVEECRGGSGGEEWVAKMTVLIENVEHHAEEEENEMFPKVRSQLGDAVTAMGEEITAQKKQLGAPTAEDAIDLTKEELLEKARAQEIPGRSTMDHEELALTVDPRF